MSSRIRMPGGPSRGEDSGSDTGGSTRGRRMTRGGRAFDKDGGRKKFDRRDDDDRGRKIKRDDDRGRKIKRDDDRGRKND